MLLQEECAHVARKRHGFTRSGHQRFRCKDCGASFTEKTEVLGGMRLDLSQAEQVIKCLMEGMSIMATCRLTGVSKPTVLDLIVSLGERCQRFMQAAIKNVVVHDVECDELWNFVYCKDRTRRRLSLPVKKYGDQYCFVGMERNTKLILAWHFGQRDTDHGRIFINKLADATAKVPFQLTTDGWAGYKQLVPGWLRQHRVDFAMLIKIYAQHGEEGRYSPPAIIETKRKAVCGQPDLQMACTSHIERQNLTIRMSLRRYTRLTNGFSRKMRNHEAALAIYFAHYNWCRKHSTLRTTPAVASKLTDHVWSVRELLEKVAAY
jgi:transposase-like protein/IS1 family transposase